MIAFLDFETFSPANLKTAGLSRYAEHKGTDIRCCCYTFDDEEEIGLWVPGMPLPSRLFQAEKFVAHHDNFERHIWARILYHRHGWPDCPPPEAWICTMSLALSFGLEAELRKCAAALGVETQIDPEKRRRILKMSKPDRKGNMPDAELDVWALYGDCANDVRAERDVWRALPKQQLSESEQRTRRHQDQINRRGICVDLEKTLLLSRAVRKLKEKLIAEAQQLTGFSPAQRDKFLAWLRENGAEGAENLTKQTVTELLGTMPEGTARRALELRAAVSKNSVKKYDKMLQQVSPDGRLRFSMVWHGASTGRVSHKGFQPGNLPSRHGLKYPPHLLIEWDEIIADPDALSIVEDPMEAYSAMVRSILIASPGKRLMAGDFSLIEARKNAWFAGALDLLDAFRRGVDIYKLMAGKIYKRDPETIHDDSRERFVGKSAVLGAGYGLGPGGFIEYCAKNGSELTAEEAETAIGEFRESNPKIVEWWHAVGRAARQAVEEPGARVPVRSVVYYCTANRRWLFCKLPNGRVLSYYKPRLVKGRWERPELMAEGFDSRFSHKWGLIKLWHGLLVENIVQGCARDVMVEAALRLEHAGYPEVLSVHDEVICDVPEKHGSLAQFVEIMEAPVPWAPGLPVKVKAWEGRRYRK